MKHRHASLVCLVLTCIAGNRAIAAETADAGGGYLSFVPFIRDNPCHVNRYRQLAASFPLQNVSAGDKGHPWRAMYGFCVAQRKRLSLHQDLVISYLDAKPFGGEPGGDGVALGTDFSFQWRQKYGASLTPYYELGLGIQYAAMTPFPAHGSRWTFTINAGAGLLIPVTPAMQINTALRYLHMSNAGLLPKNAGYDAIHLVVGWRWGIRAE